MPKPQTFKNFNYNKDGICTNPEILLQHESTEISYTLVISECNVGWCVGFTLDMEKTTPVEQKPSISHVHHQRNDAIMYLCSQAYEFFKGNIKNYPALKDLSKYIIDNGLKELIDKEKKSRKGPLHVVKASSQEEKPEDPNAPDYTIIFAEINDDYCNYHYRITKGPHKDFVHKVSNKTGIIDEDMRTAFGRLAVHLAVKDDIFKHSGREIEDIDLMHTDELATLYTVTAFKIKGESSAETAVLVGNKYLSDGSRMELETPKIAIDNLSSYKWWDQLNQALSGCRKEVSLYHEGKYTIKEKTEPEPDKNQGSLFQSDAGTKEFNEHDHEE